MDIHIAAKDGDARLCDLVPVARDISDLLCATIRGELMLSGRKVPCRRGCWSCCKCLVPLSVPEVIQLTEDVLALPRASRKKTLTSLVQTAATIIYNSYTSVASLDELSRWYSGLELDCPLLKDGICTMYRKRPLACREHLVSGLPCGRQQNAQTTRIEMPASMTHVLADIAAEFEGTLPEAVMLPLASAWYEGNSARAMRTWPGYLLAERLAAALSQQQFTHAAAQ